MGMLAFSWCQPVVAAFNIGGLTIQRALNILVEHGNSTAYRKLGAERLRVMEKRQHGDHRQNQYCLVSDDVLYTQEVD